MTATLNPRGSAARVHLGGDHAAYELKEQLITWLRQQEYEVVDIGSTNLLRVHRLGVEDMA